MTTAIIAAFAALVLVGVLGTVARVGKPAKPVTGGVAVWTTVLGLLELAALLYLNSRV